jgi:hypothetical protein
MVPASYLKGDHEMKKKPDTFIVCILNNGRFDFDWCILRERYSDRPSVKEILASDLTLGEANERLAYFKSARIAVSLFPPMVRC